MNEEYFWYEVQTNSDLSEGRGRQVPVMETRDLNVALAEVKRIGPQGSDGDIVAKCLGWKANGIPEIKMVAHVYGRTWNWEAHRNETFLMGEEQLNTLRLNAMREVVAHSSRRSAVISERN